MGQVTPSDFAAMQTLFTTVKSPAQHAVTRRQRQHTSAAYASLNSYAMLLAQILFVDNSIKEGLRDLIQDAARDRVLDGLSASIRARSATNGAALSPEDAGFYATLFLLQTAFDTLFVPDEDIVTYDTTSGAYHVTDRYDHSSGTWRSPAASSRPPLGKSKPPVMTLRLGGGTGSTA
jgi:hypothetical protein